MRDPIGKGVPRKIYGTACENPKHLENNQQHTHIIPPPRLPNSKKKLWDCTTREENETENNRI